MSGGDLVVDIEHVDLDEDDAAPDVPTTGVYVSLVPADGMRYSVSVYVEGTPTAVELAEMIQRASVAAAAAHSPELLNAVRGPGY
jgi:hypothetical protein